MKYITLNATLSRTENKLKNKQTWVEKPQVSPVYEISAAFFWNWQHDMLTPQRSIPRGLQGVLSV